MAYLCKFLEQGRFFIINIITLDEVVLPILLCCVSSIGNDIPMEHFSAIVLTP